MAERVHKSFRLPSDLASELDAYAVSHSLSATAVAEAALRDYLSRGTERGTGRGTEDAGSGGFRNATGFEGAGVSEAIHALTAQLAVKDAQLEARDRHIAALTERLAEAQATARTAQALEGAQVAKALAEAQGSERDASDAEAVVETVARESEPERVGFLRRLARRFRSG